MKQHWLAYAVALLLLLFVFQPNSSAVAGDDESGVSILHVGQLSTVGSEDNLREEELRREYEVARRAYEEEKKRLKREAEERKFKQLNAACREKNLQRVTELLKQGTTPDWSVLLLSVARGHDDVLRLLLQYGGDIHQRSEGGHTLLYHASLMGHEVVARVLLENGLQPNVADNEGNTPLLATIYGNREAVARLLLENGAEIDAVDEKGRTPLHKAAMSGKPAMVRLLLDRVLRPILRTWWA